MYSMTGYGKGAASFDGRELTVELKSVNHRNLDVSMRLPRVLACIEDTIRQTIAARIHRGHVDVFVNYRNTRSDAKTVLVDSVLIAEYVAAAREANKTLSLTDDMTLSNVLRLPDVTEIVPADEDSNALQALCRDAVNRAIDAMLVMRKNEGERLMAAMSAEVDQMEAYRVQMEARAPYVADAYRQKLNDRIAAVLSDTEIDRARLATEVALFADRCCIDEELVRLQSHIVQMRDYFRSEEPVGRNMDFLVQEMNRECNTIGSKANDLTLTECVLKCKAEIEKLREQTQNLE